MQKKHKYNCLKEKLYSDRKIKNPAQTGTIPEIKSIAAWTI